MQPVVIGGVIIVPDIIRANLDGNGQISVQLPSTNDPDLSVTGWTYTVMEHMDNGRGPYQIEVPYTVPTLDLATIPVATPNPSIPSESVLHLSDVGVVVAAQSSVVGLENLGATGFGMVVHTGTNTWTSRIITSASAAALTIADGDGINGNPVITIDATLGALAGQNWAANTIPIGTGVDTATQLSIPVNTFPARSSTGDIAAKPLTDYALTLLDDANQASARSTLGAVGSSDLAAVTSGLGTDLVGFQEDIAATPYLKTVSDMLNGLPIPITRWIDPTKLSAIRDFTSTYDAATDINDALAEYLNFIVPPGLYRIGTTLNLRDRTTLRGGGWSVPYSGATVQAPQGTVFKLISGSNTDMFRQAAKASRYSLNLSGFALDGDGANQSNNMGPDGTFGMYQFNRNGFFFEALYNTVFEEIFVYNMRGAGWALHGDGSVGMTNVFLKSCHGYNCRTYNIYTEGNTTDVRINGGDFGFGRVANLRLTSSNTINDAVFWTSQCQDITDANTHSTGTGAVVNGGILIAVDNNKLTGIRSEGNAGHGIKIVGNDNSIDASILYFNAATAGSSGNFDGINDAGDRNKYQDLDIRQSTSSAFALRKAIKLEAGHSDSRIYGGDIARVGANAAAVTLPVQGFSFTSGDKSDFTWGTGEVKAHATIANSIGTTATVVNFDTETVDSRGEFSADVFTAAESGIYRIDTGVNIANATDGNSFIVAVYKNGNEYRRLGQQRAGAGAAIQICGGLEMKLELGDTIDIRGTCGTATNTNVGAAITWVEITQING